MVDGQGPGDGGVRGDGAHPRGGPVARRYADDDTTYTYLPPVVEPGLVFEPPPPKRGWGDRSMAKDLGLVLFVVAAVVVGYVTWSYVGQFTATALTKASPSPPAVALTSPSPATSPVATASSLPEPESSASAAPSATAKPKPQRKPVNVRIEPKPKAMFVTELKNTWCAAAAVQIALNVNGPKVNTTDARQASIRKREVAATTRKDSRNGGAGPNGMVATLNDLGSVTYKLRIYDTRAQALHDAARAISATKHAVILLAWRGAHAWVMTGYKADADPRAFKNAKVSGAYIIDPWYPRVSRIWGRSDPPGTFQNASEMRRNYLPWKRPEGKYPGRDGKFLALVPADAP